MGVSLWVAPTLFSRFVFCLGVSISMQCCTTAYRAKPTWVCTVQRTHLFNVAGLCFSGGLDAQHPSSMWARDGGTQCSGMQTTKQWTLLCIACSSLRACRFFFRSLFLVVARACVDDGCILQLCSPGVQLSLCCLLPVLQSARPMTPKHRIFFTRHVCDYLPSCCPLAC
jgi:hypothetical protein